MVCSESPALEDGGSGAAVDSRPVNARRRDQGAGVRDLLFLPCLYASNVALRTPPTRRISRQIASPPSTMQPSAALTRAGLAILVASLAACLGIPVEPEVPELRESGSSPGETSELFVIVRSPTAGQDADRKVRRVVFVDGAPRAVFLDAPGYTRIPVLPGPHSVVVSHRMSDRSVFVAFPVPVPLHFEKSAETSVTCESSDQCGVVIDEHPPTTWRGFRMSAQPVPREQLDQSIRGLAFTEPDR